MERLHLSGLPESCSVGPAFLRPRSDADGLLQPCRVCNKVNASYHLCASGHSLCPDCIPPSNVRRKWCVICRAAVDFTAENIPRRVIESMVFSCICSYTAPLPKIREHLMQTSSPQLCFRQDGFGDKEEPENPSERLTQLEKAFDGLIREHEGSQDALWRLEKEIPGMKESLSKVRTICDVLCDSRHILCFSFDKLLSRHLCEEHTIVNGVPLRVQVFIGSLNDEPYLGVTVAGSDIEVDASLDIWPLEKCITVDVLDAQGSTLVSHEILTLEDGEYADPSFITPTPEVPGTPSGVLFFVSLNDVSHFYPKRGSENFIISLRVGEMVTSSASDSETPVLKL